MTQVIALLVETLLRALLPATGRHRAVRAAGCAPVAVPVPPPGPPRSVHRTPPVFLGMLPPRAEASRLRPYVLGEAERRQRALQRQRRCALWLAVHGIDAGPRRIHGVQVAAR